MKTRKIYVYPSWCDVRVDSNLKTTLTVHDEYRHSRKDNIDIVLEGLQPYMLSHIAEKCVYALNTIESRVADRLGCIDDAIKNKKVKR